LEELRDSRLILYFFEGNYAKYMQ